MARKLNIGCGEKVKSGSEWINLDFVKFPGVDKVHDLNKFPYPFKNDEFEEVYCSHILEHVPDLTKVIAELYRICKDRAIIRIRAPHFSSFSYYTDPTHKIPFGHLSFDDLLDDFVQEVKYKNKKTPLFRVITRRLNFTRTKAKFLNRILNPLINLSPLTYERFLCWIFPCSEVLFELRIVKNDEGRERIIRGERIII